MRGVPRHKTKFLKVPSRDDFQEKDQQELIDLAKEEALSQIPSKAKKEKKSRRKAS
jgi:hypothetical protein